MDWYIGSDWKDTARGLHKRVLSLQFVNIEKPHIISTILFTVNKRCSNLGTRSSKYLDCNDMQQHSMEMGTAVTPIDCYLEILLQQFLPGETSACSIHTKSDEQLEFELKLDRIISNTQVENLKAFRIHKLALRYKECGVTMFKTYPKFALDYFSRAARLLMTYKPFDKVTQRLNGIEGAELETLFIQIKTNMAACLLAEKRYEHVLYHTEFVDTQENPTEKSIYRRALAYYYLKEFEKAQRMIERVPNYEEKREFSKLRDNIATSWRSSNADYKQLVQRMFN